MAKNFLKTIVVAPILFVLAMPLAGANEATLQKEITSLQKAIQSRRAQLSSESASLKTKLEEKEKEAKSIEKRLERHERKLERAEKRYSFVIENINELNEWYDGLGAIDQGLNSSTYETKMNALNVDKDTAQSELREVESEEKALLDEKQSVQQELRNLQAKFKSASSSVENDKRLKTLLSQKAQKEKELQQLKSAKQVRKSVPRKPEYNAYVYAISGKEEGRLEKSLKLESWVESYGAKYIQANWNDLTRQSSSKSGSMIQFLSQIDKEFSQLSRNANIILIGYGMGGGAAVLAATEVAAKQNRDIELLVTIDPMGPGESRMNAVYEAEAYCQGRISPQQYISCLSNAEKREITKNVKSFYNRWQRESKIPMDALDRMVVNDEEHVLSTGKFLLESSETLSNQKRVYFDDKDAHELILQEAAEELPKLMVPHLR